MGLYAIDRAKINISLAGRGKATYYLDLSWGERSSMEPLVVGGSPFQRGEMAGDEGQGSEAGY